VKERPIHYAGGVLYRSGAEGCTEMLPGWPACCSGDRARRIAAAGEQSTDIARVTCARCRDLWQRTREDHLELHAHRRDFEGRFALRALCVAELTTLGQMIEPIDSTLRVELKSEEQSTPSVTLTPREAVLLGRVLVAWGRAREGGRP
jgi:hypothetical protein